MFLQVRLSVFVVRVRNNDENSRIVMLELSLIVNEKLVDLSAALRDALKVLRFDPRELRWMHPEIKISELD